MIRKDNLHEKHPNWVEAEREKFKEIRDLDKDGVLDKDEVANWLFPIWGELTQEAVHLIYEADQNGDTQKSI